MKETILDIATNEISEQDYSPAQIKEAQEAQAKAENLKLQQAAKAAQRAALLERLGLTEEEAKLLLG